MLNIINGAFGYVAYEAKVDPATLSRGRRAAVRTEQGPVGGVCCRPPFPAAPYNKLENEQPFERRSREDVYQLVIERIVRTQVVDSCGTVGVPDPGGCRSGPRSLQSIPEAELDFISWLTPTFVTRPQTSEALTAGVRTAILGTLWTMLITILVAFPVGVGAAIYLEEYASDNWFNRFIRTNINNLAGVPSIIYGILGLAIFVRALEPLTSGAVFRRG